MKTPASRERMLSHACFPFIELLFLVTILLLKPCTCTGAAVTFTNDTLIGPFDTNFDGTDIVLSDCTVTIDGQHSFASLQVRDGGVLTHSFSTNGLLALTGSVTGEVQVLTLTNVALLNNSGVIASSIVVSDLARTLAYSNGVDYVVLDQGNGLVGLQLVVGSAIPEGSTNLVDYVFNRPAVPVGLNLVIATNVWVEVGGRVLMDGRGYGGGMGPGAGVSLGYPLYSGSGGGHGGFGGAAWTNSGLKQVGAVYGSVRGPLLPGSGGGGGLNTTGGAGGGALKLIAGGWVRIDGTVSANGAPGLSPRTGGGAGGSVWISCQTLLGSGGIFANGGTGEPGKGGGGGGGRIALYQSLDLFDGALSAIGAGGWQRGGPGTLYTRLADQPVGTLVMDNGGPAGSSLLLPDSEPVQLSILGGTLLGLQSTLTFTNLEVGSNAWIQLTTQGINVLRDAIIEAGGGLLADGSGYASGTGPGAGHYYSYQGIMTGGGGGHGGVGAVGGNGPLASGGTGYDSFTAPALPGSGGGTSSGSAGAGGGVIKLNVGGSLVLNGLISADGTAGIYDGSGGGAGGSVWITANALAGTGTISADGGAGNGFGPFAGGGGGGGRISLQYAQNLFFGAISARGGGGFAWGGAGTIYTKMNNQLAGQLLLDNGGPLGAGTVWTYAAGNTLDLVVRAGAISGVPSQQQPLSSLLIGPDGWLLLTNQLLTVNGNATIQSGGKLVADGLGYPSGQGPGAGRSDYRYSSAGGGGYGGNGGSVPGSTFPTGGTGYGNPTSPTELGSGGGSPSYYSGGAGGGNLRLTVNGVLEVDGRLSSNGTDAVGAGAGGGSGGSLYLNAGSLSGSGIISANGGQGLGGGGGGGGRIALFCGSNAFSGSLQARGGSGISWGGAGTIYKTTRYGSYYGLLLIDNGGQPGAFTPLYSIYQVDLILSGGAICTASYTVNLSSLLIGSNSWVVMSNSYAPGWTVMSNAIIQAGGGIVADGTGFPGGAGTGAGRYSSYTAGGGGYGGYGGAGTNLPAYGGTIYGSLTTPSDPGSGGGSAGYYSGGSGGGAIRLTVNGALQVDGKISANGLSGTNSSAGGGSGGSIYLTIGTLTGSGIISANGGMGNVSGGGGGGGRIAIYYGANVFQGNLSAFGGGGVRRGGAGTIYTKQSNQQTAQVIVDNGGLRGTNTSWSGSYPVQLVVSGGGVFVPSFSQTLSGLSVASNGWVFLGVGNQPLTITGSATVQAGGGIIADGTGYAGGQGPGAGAPQSLSSYGWTAGGGGHGGYGSSGAGGTGALGGGTYDVVTAPTIGGSGGGGVVNPTYGGAGGGVIRLTVTGALVVNGRISANGVPGGAPGAGGGAGGSLWLTVGTLSGSGSISANGGPGNGWGGGGGGGRVAIEYSATLLPVSISAYGGAGATSFGGAGTIYLRPMSQQLGRVLVDNGGQPGTNTPLVSLSAPFDLTIQNGAILVPQTSSLMLNNLFVGPGATLKPFAPASVLDLSVLRDTTIDSGGTLVADGQGSVANTGVGHGLLNNGVGSGAGYGGMGGAGSNVLGGATYGSEQQPLSSGSGGGASSPSSPGSSGGGVIRLSVGRALTVNGLLSANGNAGAADNAGGGSGGSIWVDANYLTGAGVIAANGGAGELALGGGGGGGRIAMYSPLNVFQGVVVASGGDGYARGQDGTIYSSSAFAPFEAVSHTPAGAVGSPIDSIYLTLNTAFSPASLTTSDVLLMTPTGLLSQASCTVSAFGARQVRIGFPAQTAEGDYKFTFGPQLQSLFGQPLSEVYTGTFSIVWPTIQGMVTDTNNQPLAGVVILAGDGVAPTVTDTNGNYLLKVVPGSSGNVVPQYTGLNFVPLSHSFSNLTYPLVNQDFLAITGTIVPTMTSSIQDNGLVLSWYGLSGVTYHTLVSTNLVDWSVDDGPFWGTNGLMEVHLPLGAAPQGFFRLQADY